MMTVFAWPVRRVCTAEQAKGLISGWSGEKGECALSQPLDMSPLIESSEETREIRFIIFVS